MRNTICDAFGYLSVTVCGEWGPSFYPKNPKIFKIVFHKIGQNGYGPISRLIDPLLSIRLSRPKIVLLSTLQILHSLPSLPLSTFSCQLLRVNVVDVQKLVNPTSVDHCRIFFTKAHSKGFRCLSRYFSVVRSSKDRMLISLKGTFSSSPSHYRFFLYFHLFTCSDKTLFSEKGITNKLSCWLLPMNAPV